MKINRLLWAIGRVFDNPMYCYACGRSFTPEEETLVIDRDMMEKLHKDLVLDLIKDKKVCYSCKRYFS